MAIDLILPLSDVDAIIGTAANQFDSLRLYRASSRGGTYTLATTITSVNIIDKRVMINLPSSTLFDHGSLLGLTDDDHTMYHTNARALTWLATRSTDDLPEGINLYFTNERVC